MGQIRRRSFTQEIAITGKKKKGKIRICCAIPFVSFVLNSGVLFSSLANCNHVLS